MATASPAEMRGLGKLLQHCVLVNAHPSYKQTLFLKYSSHGTLNDLCVGDSSAPAIHGSHAPERALDLSTTSVWQPSSLPSCPFEGTGYFLSKTV